MESQRREERRSSHDVVIIGSGLGAWAAARMARETGADVRLSVTTPYQGSLPYAAEKLMNGLRGLAVSLLALLLPACQQQTWEAAMAAGQQAVQQGNYADAERIFLAAVHKAEEFGLQDRRVAVSLSQLAQVYAGQGKYVEAEPIYLQALKIYEGVYGENHADVAATLNNLGVLHRMYGQYAQAEPLLLRALAIKEKLFGPDHLEVALSMCNLAQLRVAQGQPDKAEPLYRRALAIREKSLGDSHPDVGKTLDDLANVLRRLKRPDEAASLEARARAVRAQRS
jgi:tetratricopeptide (TPR) repeat protein